MVERRGAEQDERNGKPQPHEWPLHKGTDPRVILPLLGHVHRQLQQREGQPVVVHPLPADQHHDGDHHQVDRQNERTPGGNGNSPVLPGNAHPLGQPFEEVFDGIRVVRHHPVFDVRVQQFRPVVLRRGVVEDPRQHGDQIGRKPPGRNRRGDDRHDVDDHQFRSRESPRSPAQLEHRVYESGQQKEEEDRPGGDVVGRHTGRSHGQPGVREEDVDGQRKKRADEQRPKSETSRHQPCVLRGRPVAPERIVYIDCCPFFFVL